MRNNPIELDSLSHLPTELVAFARRQFVNATLYKGDERRREARHPMVLPLRAVAVDADANPIGDPFDCITRDVSSKSIGLIHSDLLTARHLAIEIELAGVKVNLKIELVWSGAMGPFYGAAGVYLRRLGSFPTRQQRPQSAHSPGRRPHAERRAESRISSSDTY